MAPVTTLIVFIQCSGASTMDAGRSSLPMMWLLYVHRAATWKTLLPRLYWLQLHRNLLDRFTTSAKKKHSASWNGPAKLLLPWAGMVSSSCCHTIARHNTCSGHAVPRSIWYCFLIVFAIALLIQISRPETMRDA